MKTVFITGASSGIGRESAKLFQQRGWNVLATMRNPMVEQELTKLKNVKVLPCDVTDQDSIYHAVQEGIHSFGKIDVLINNAGYYTVGPLEGADFQQVRGQLDTNLLGLIAVTKAMLPHFRKNRSGVIINLSSIAGCVSIPLQSLYHATKFGVEGFSESLQYELEAFNIKVKLIEPGTIKTNFCGRSMTVVDYDDLPEYMEYSDKVISNLINNGNIGSAPEEVAHVIYRAATDNRKKMRYPVGKMKEMIMLHKILPLSLYQKVVATVLG